MLSRYFEKLYFILLQLLHSNSVLRLLRHIEILFLKIRNPIVTDFVKLNDLVVDQEEGTPINTVTIVHNEYHTYREIHFFFIIINDPYKNSRDEKIVISVLLNIQLDPIKYGDF